MIRTVPKNLRLADRHEEAQAEAQAQTPQLDPTVEMDLLLPPAVAEETLFVPEPIFETPRSDTPGGRRRLRPRPEISGARPRSTPRKRNYGFDTDAEESGAEA